MATMKAACVLLLVTTLATCSAFDSVAPIHLLTEDTPVDASVNINLGNSFPLKETLYGIFFEEIGHAGDGGFYAELIQDRSFDALAAATGFSSAGANPAAHRLPIDWAALEAHHPIATEPLTYPWSESPVNGSFSSRREYMEIHGRGAHSRDNTIVLAWSPLPGTQTALNKNLPVNENNPISMEISVAQGVDQGGIINIGYWGIPLETSTSYTISLFVRNPGSTDTPLTLSLLSGDLSTHHADMTVMVKGGEESGATWQKVEGELVPAQADSDARLAVIFGGPATLIIDSVSLFPTANVEKAKQEGHMNPWPFRTDLLQALKDLNPGFLRFPGGCIVEGDWLRNRFNWKTALGPNEGRPGHYDLWGYWSDDGLGVFEYMVLVEELGTEPVWVINNGVAHADSVPASDVMPYVQDALDSIEFITGPPDSPWGSIRASMGHPDPWQLSYMAIGNEDCGKPYYLNNYLLFFGAISAKYPHMRLISNCDMGLDAPTDLWDWHIYTNPLDMFNKRREFDGQTPENAHYVFASEYAVTAGGGWGNLIGAVSEAAFMTGMERNGRIVSMGAYAPLFVHTNDRIWPTNMIVIDNHRWYGIPSYYVQQMFRAVQGEAYAETSVTETPSPSHEEKVAASATCQDQQCSQLAVKIINFSSYQLNVSVDIQGLSQGADIAASAPVTILTSDHPEDENSFEEPYKVTPVSQTIEGLSSSFSLGLPPYSVNVVMLHVNPAPAGHAGLEESMSGDVEAASTS